MLLVGQATVLNLLSMQGMGACMEPAVCLQRQASTYAWQALCPHSLSVVLREAHMSCHVRHGNHELLIIAKHA